jgi:hypothetical protein
MYKNYFSMFLLVACPTLMLLPPRRLNGYAALQGFGFLWAANEQSEQRTRRDLVYWSEAPFRWVSRTSRKLRGVEVAPRTDEARREQEPMLVPAIQDVAVPDETTTLKEQLEMKKAELLQRKSQEPKSWASDRLRKIMWVDQPQVRDSESKREG